MDSCCHLQWRAGEHSRAAEEGGGGTGELQGTRGIVAVTCSRGPARTVGKLRRQEEEAQGSSRHTREIFGRLSRDYSTLERCHKDLKGTGTRTSLMRSCMVS